MTYYIIVLTEIKFSVSHIPLFRGWSSHVPILTCYFLNISANLLCPWDTSFMFPFIYGLLIYDHNMLLTAATGFHYIYILLLMTCCDILNFAGNVLNNPNLKPKLHTVFENFVFLLKVTDLSLFWPSVQLQPHICCIWLFILS